MEKISKDLHNYYTQEQSDNTSNIIHNKNKQKTKSIRATKLLTKQDKSKHNESTYTKLTQTEELKSKIVDLMEQQKHYKDNTHIMLTKTMRSIKINNKHCNSNTKQINNFKKTINNTLRFSRNLKYFIIQRAKCLIQRQRQQNLEINNLKQEKELQGERINNMEQKIQALQEESKNNMERQIQTQARQMLKVERINNMEQQIQIQIQQLQQITIKNLEQQITITNLKQRIKELEVERNDKLIQQLKLRELLSRDKK